MLIQTSPRRAKALQPYIFRIIATRLHDHPDITWDEIDQQLALILDSFFQDSALTGQYLEGGPRGVADLFAVESNRNVGLLLLVVCLELIFILGGCTWIPSALRHQMPLFLSGYTAPNRRKSRTFTIFEFTAHSTQTSSGCSFVPKLENELR